MRDLLFEVQRGVATLSINRPKSRNALALQTMAELGGALDALKQKRARVLVIRGVGYQAFCAGGDLKEAALASSIAAAPVAAIAGIKRSVDAVRPHRNPEVAGATIDAFAKRWAHPAHWTAVARMEKRRRSKK